MVRAVALGMVSALLGCTGAAAAAQPHSTASESAAAPLAGPEAARSTDGPAEDVSAVVQSPRVHLLTGGPEPVRVDVEVVRSELDRARGLMHRRHLAPDAGMLFVFSEMRHQSFWMENTFIPLDIIFIDDQMRVVGVVENAEPLTREGREVDGDSQYVLEVNAGFAADHGIEPGTQVRFLDLAHIDQDEDAR